jgi:hypothetical protein
VDGDSVYIPPGITVILDINPPTLGALVLDGTLKFDPSMPELNLTTGYILVRVRGRAGTNVLLRRWQLLIAGPAAGRLEGLMEAALSRAAT